MSTLTAPAPTGSVDTPIARRLAPPELQEFLLLEAELLDTVRFDQWLSLYTDDCLYWMPAEPDQTEGEGRISLFYDDRSILEDRVWRLGHPKMFSQNPRARQVRLISNILIEAGCDPEAPVVHSNFIMFEHRLRSQRVFGGRSEHWLRRVDGAWRIARKIVRLANCEASLWNIGVPL
jgi:ethylbenzene dioxygenase subunit beta